MRRPDNKLALMRNHQRQVISVEDWAQAHQGPVPGGVRPPRTTERLLVMYSRGRTAGQRALKNLQASAPPQPPKRRRCNAACVRRRGSAGRALGASAQRQRLDPQQEAALDWGQSPGCSLRSRTKHMSTPPSGPRRTLGCWRPSTAIDCCLGTENARTCQHDKVDYTQPKLFYDVDSKIFERALGVVFCCKRPEFLHLRIIQRWNLSCIHALEDCVHKLHCFLLVHFLLK